MKCSWILMFVLMASLMFAVGCNTDKQPGTTPSASIVSTSEKPKPNFVPLTAEQAYRLQDDCTHRGDVILQENLIGSGLTQEVVARYNSTTNRCYVKLEVHAADLTQMSEIDYSTYLEDGQTKELLAFVTRKPGFDEKGNRKITALGFGCDITASSSCVEDKIAACMQGKECDPQ